MILERIASYKREFVAERKKKIPLRELEGRIASMGDEVRDFEGAVRRGAGEGIKIIAESKKASPSKGVICEDYKPGEIASMYERGGADAISVLTDEEFFGGSLGHLGEVRERVRLPILRKDFVVDEYQIYEGRSAGADAILLIAALLDAGHIKDYLQVAYGLGLKVLVEVHTEEEVKVALSSGARIIGINNRDLRTFETDVRNTERLYKHIPKDRIVVSESGISSREDVKYLEDMGVDAVLVGEYLMRQGEIERGLKKLRGAV